MFGLPAAAKLIVCILLPRFELTVAAGTRTDLLGIPAAVAPGPGSQSIGAVSAAAEAFGIVPGMRLGESLARCQRLTLIPPDPAGVQERWERTLIALESIGAAVEPMRPGFACFDARGLLRLYGGAGGQSGDLGQAPRPELGEAPRPELGSLLMRRDVEAVLTAARRAIRAPARFGVASTRFAALAAATRARVGQPLVLAGGARRYVSSWRRCRSSCCAARLIWRCCPRRCSGSGSARSESSRRCRGRPSPIASGGPACTPRGSRSVATLPLRPREAGEVVSESLELPEIASGQQLERALGLLIDRLLARRERRGRTLRTVVLSAVLVEHGGTWRQHITFRESLSDPARMRLALTPRLQLLPAPAQKLLLTVERFGPPTSRPAGAARGAGTGTGGAPARGDPTGARRRRSRRRPACPADRSELTLP